MFAYRIAGGLAIAAAVALGTSPVCAEPTSNPITISQLRPYIGGSGVFVYLNGAGPCGQQAGPYGIYTIDLSSSAGKAAYAAALIAVATGKQVQLEVISGACGTQYPGLQSIYIGA